VPSEADTEDATQGPAESVGSATDAKSARQTAMSLPLVREVFEQFPSASLTDVRQGSKAGQANQAMPPADDPDSTNPAANDADPTMKNDDDV
jgi:hypothetical protein